MNRISASRCAVVALALGGFLAGAAHAQNSQGERLRAALASPERSAENRARDATRRPADVIEFLGIEPGMTVLDVIAAGGWYTEVLSAAVGPNGTVLSQNPDFFASREGFIDAAEERAAQLGNVELVIGDIGDAGIDGRADAAVSALNLHDIYHNGGEQGAVGLLRGIHGALKPGGVFGLIDHRGDPGRDNADMHRLPVETARELLTAAGFVVEAESDLLANPADDRTLGIREPSLERNSDRFLLRARKPR